MPQYPPPAGQGRARSDRIGHLGRFGCLVGLVLVHAWMVFGLGCGLPNSYWLRISQIQAFEDADGVTLFVEVQQAERYASVFQEAPVHRTRQLLRLRVTGAGQVECTSFPVPSLSRYGPLLTFNTNLDPIVRLSDQFYLVEGTSRRLSTCELHRLGTERIESLGSGESAEILRSVGIEADRRSRRFDDFADLDAVSQRYGWSRINGSSYGAIPGFDQPVDTLLKTIRPTRHDWGFRLIRTASVESIRVESGAGSARWSRPILTVDSTRIKLYRRPRE